MMISIGMMGNLGGASVLACGEKINIGTLSCCKFSFFFSSSLF